MIDEQHGEEVCIPSAGGGSAGPVLDLVEPLMR